MARGYICVALLHILLGLTNVGCSDLFTIEGKVIPPEPKPSDWHWTTRILIDGGVVKTAFIKEDNTFLVQGLPSGSYLVEVANPTYTYEPARVEVTSKGKTRARKVNNVQPTAIAHLAYPLKFKTLGKTKYFAMREEWRASDVLYNPMIWMMVMPLLLVSVLPKLISDPETKKELEEVRQSMNVQQTMPEMSEIMANLFGGGVAGGSGTDKRRKTNPRSSAPGPATNLPRSRIHS